MEFKTPPLSMPSQVMDDRGFERAYHRNPIGQARFAAHLIGLREFLLRQNGDESAESITTIDETLCNFREQFPEFMFPEFTGDNDLAGGTYRADPVLIGRMNGILKNHERS